MCICGKDDIERFKKEVGFLHPRKKKKLLEAINSYRNFVWKIPKTKKELILFIEEKGKERKSHSEIRLNTIVKDNLLRLKKALKKFGISTKIHGPWKNQWDTNNYCMSIKIDELNYRG